jgi:hypothetical protein
VAALAVWVGRNDPHALVGMQLQFTPASAESPVTVAAMFAFVPVVREDGGGVVSATLIWVAGLMAMGEVRALFVVSVTDVAVMITARDGTVVGAMYVMAVPLAEFGMLNVPQVFAGVQDQVTPAFLESFTTVAVMGVVSLMKRDVGVTLKETEMAGGVTGGVGAPGAEGAEPLEPPQAKRPAIMPNVTICRQDLGNVIEAFL